jgi:hypothetical protein
LGPRAACLLVRYASLQDAYIEVLLYSQVYNSRLETFVSELLTLLSILRASDYRYTFIVSLKRV